MKLIDADALMEAIEIRMKSKEDDFKAVSELRAMNRYIAQVSPVKKQDNEWIPMEERLPEEDTVYLVTMMTPGYFDGQPYTNWLCWYCDDREWADTNGDAIPEQDTVIAWMPVIGPYKPRN